MKSKVLLLGLAVVILTTGCSDSDGGDSNLFTTECLQGTGKQEVFDIMRDWYFWNDETEQADKYMGSAGDFSNVDELLDFLRYRPTEFDRGFTFVTTPEEESIFFEEGKSIGFGFGLTRIGNTHEIRVTQIFAGSPAEIAGIERGYRLTAINGRSIQFIDFNEGINEALGPAEVGDTRTLSFQDREGTPLPDVELSKAVHDLDPVAEVKVIDNAGVKVGYIFFRTFISTAVGELRTAMAQFQDEQVRNLVIDLRYNGGGLVSVAEVLGSLLSAGNVGSIFFIQEFNSDHMGLNQAGIFHSESSALDLDKIVFITSGGTASASELLINGLEPYFQDEDIAIVGTPSYGKPVGQSGFDFCGGQQRLRAVTFKTVNVMGEGDYFTGLPVDCPATDDLQALLGDEGEASLSTALQYLRDGSCTGGVATAQSLESGAGGKLAAKPILSGPKIWHHYAGAF
ncbi:MAG TPA: S41 family peptidase [Gammaproteobacteria bacterium]